MERGRPPRIGPAAREHICRIASCKPAELGLPFTAWSLAKLVDYLADTARIRVCTETARQILRDVGVSWQATKTWKASTDPDFVIKKDRILELYDNPPADGRVICVDEFGPLNLQPRPGRGWFPRQRPARLRATYTDQKVGKQWIGPVVDKRGAIEPRCVEPVRQRDTDGRGRVPLVLAAGVQVRVGLPVSTAIAL